jgi:tight adherence protein C
MFLLSLVALLLLGGSVALVARAIALLRLRAADQIREIEQYGFHAPEPVTAGPAAPALGDLAGHLGGAAAGVLRWVHPERTRRDILAAALYRLTPNALLGYRLLLAGAFAVMALLLVGRMGVGGALLFGAPTTLIAWMLPLVLVRRRGRMRLDAIDRELPEMVDLLVVTVEAGMGLGASIQLAASKIRGPLADELRLVLQEQRMGRAMSEALMSMLQRTDTASMRSFVRSLVQGETLGVSVGTIMRNLSEEMRKRRRQYAEERAQKAPTKLLFPLVFLILPAFMLIAIGPAVFSLMDALGG